MTEKKGITPATGALIAVTSGTGYIPDDEDAAAEYIVRACNSYPKMVEALDRAERYIGGHNDENGERCPHYECNQHGFRLSTILGEIRAALAAAKGE